MLEAFWCVLLWQDTENNVMFGSITVTHLAGRTKDWWLLPCLRSWRGQEDLRRRTEMEKGYEGKLPSPPTAANSHVNWWKQILWTNVTLEQPRPFLWHHKRAVIKWPPAVRRTRRHYVVPNHSAAGGQTRIHQQTGQCLCVWCSWDSRPTLRGTLTHFLLDSRSIFLFCFACIVCLMFMCTNNRL